MLSRTLLIFTVACGLVLAGAPAAGAAQPYPLNFHTFDLQGGTVHGLTRTGGGLQIAATPLGTTFYSDLYANFAGDGVDGSGAYTYGTWTSGVRHLSFPFNELVSSWNAKTPVGTFIQSEVQPLFGDGHWGKWYILGQWTYSDADFHRTSVGQQGDGDGYVAIDTFFTKDHPAVAYRLRLTLFRRATLDVTPTVTRYGAIASNLTNPKRTFPSPTSMSGNGVVLPVPQYSQELHHGEYPQFDGGGEAWCSPTSSSMVVGYWAARFPNAGYAPSPAELSWVDPTFPDPWVDYTARYVYDYHYEGAGNWPFNAAYAAGRGLVSDVTQLHNLREAEPFIRDGIPLVASIAFHSNKLSGADIKSTNGHLVVIVGFTGNGDVVVDDPASPTDGAVQHVYDRAQFEKAWIMASGGIVYVDRPAGWPTPSLTANNS